MSMELAVKNTNLKKTIPTSIRFTPELLELVKNESAIAGLSVSNFIESIVIEKLEDELDIRIADERVAEWQANGKKTLSLDEMVKKYG